MEVEIKDVYFRRLIVPVVVSLLVLCGAVVIIATPPGTPAQWDTFGTAFGTATKTVGGALKKSLRK